jgi:hypothetical protein
MKKLILLCASFFTMVLLISASPVSAQNVLWVSNTGSDANTCGATAPCATFQGAINKGNVVQINCLTSGNYGPVTIQTSLTIDCGTGNVGTIFTTVGIGIAINTGSAATIVLRHLSLNGGGLATHGIFAQFPSGTLIVEDCMIQGFHGGIGIVFGPTSERGLLQVSNSQMFDNLFGIVVGPASGQVASVTLDRVELVANSNTGLVLQGTGVVAGTMRHSVVGENAVDGIFTNAGQVFFTVEESSIVANLTSGIHTNSAGSAIKVAASTIGGNGIGVNAQQGSIVSFGDNHMSDNGTNGTFTSTTALQ